MDIKLIIFIALVLIVPWAILFLFMLGSNKKTINNFRKLEEKYGLQCDYSKKVGMKNHPHAHGIYRNRNIRIESMVRDSVEGKKVIPHTALTVECVNTDNFSFTVVKRKKQNTASFSGSTLINDNEFDDKFIVQTNNPAKLTGLFDFNTKFKLDQVHMLGFDGIIKLDGNHLAYIEKGLLSDDASLMRLELVMHELCDIADVMRYN